MENLAPEAWRTVSRRWETSGGGLLLELRADVSMKGGFAHVNGGRTSGRSLIYEDETFEGDASEGDLSGLGSTGAVGEKQRAVYATKLRKHAP